MGSYSRLVIGRFCLVLWAVILWAGSSAADSLPGKSALYTSHYDILFIPDVERGSVFGRVRCTVENNGKSPVSTLSFDIMRERKVSLTVMNARQVVDAEYVDLPIEHSTSGRLVHVMDDKAPIGPVVVDLSKPLDPSESAEVEITYKWNGKISDGFRDDEDFSLSTRGISLRNADIGMPWLPVLSGVDAIFSKPKSYDIAISTPKEYEGIDMNGRLVDRVQTGDRTITRWTSQLCGFPFVLAGKYDRLFFNKLGNRVSMYLPRGEYDKGVAEETAAYVSSIYNYYGRLFGRLDGEDLKIGVDPMGGDWAMGEYMGMVLGRNAARLKPSPDSHSQDLFIIPHEMAHSWWGNSVSSKDLDAVCLLNESMAEFSRKLFVSQNYGRNLFRDDLAFDYWLSTTYGPIMSIDGDGTGRYKRGPLVLNTLRTEMGDKLFFKALSVHARKNKNKYASVSDFADVCKSVSGRDWNPFFKQWCYGDGCPNYQTAGFESVKTGNRWKTMVSIRNEGKGTVTCPLELRMDGRSVRESFSVPEGASRSFTFITCD